MGFGRMLAAGDVVSLSSFAWPARPGRTPRQARLAGSSRWCPLGNRGRSHPDCGGAHQVGWLL